MADYGFQVKEHVIPCQHIRGYHHAVKERQTGLRLAVKQYIPMSQSGSSSPVTIIATHANGIVKETYEPLWNALNDRLRGSIKAIWIADCSHQGESGVLNEGLLGDDPNWFDHSRDLLAMVNHFRDDIQPPVIGLAHSMGCAQLVQLSVMHPRLFQGILFLEPVIQQTIPPGPNAAFFTSIRRDLWDSYASAKDDFAKNKFYKSWDSRALEKYLQYGLRKCPTQLHPNANERAVTLTTPKAQEAWSYVRSTFAPHPPHSTVDDKERYLTNDYTAEQARYLFHRAEAGIAFQLLAYLQPSVKWVFGGKSYVNSPSHREEIRARSATALRGGAGADISVIRGGGHLFPLEMIDEAADEISPFIKDQLEQFLKENAFWSSYESGKSERSMLQLSDQWTKSVRMPSDTLRPVLRKEKL